ncbi:DUF4342 domain-containing protein [Azotosporobacter soli]|uniref:DUF4342 domain-containing protein n=1 Tax=Azotosporobacter soli TaxID=3055040 RepID=UPI0031FE9189
MEITLEKIDAVKERTGVSYREAKAALEACQGSVIEALIHLETHKPKGWTEEFSLRSGEVVDKVKDLVRQGNVNRICVKSEGKVLVEIPVTIGAIGAVVLPQIAALGMLAAVFKKCSIEVVRTDGSREETTVDDEDKTN